MCAWFRLLLIMELFPMQPEHWPEVARIYADGLATGIASFEKCVPGFEAWDRKHLTHSRLVAFKDGHCLGWAALAPVSAREVYRGVAEVSIYIGGDYRGRGVGSRLMEALISSSEKEGIWTLQSSIFPQNKSSLKLHLNKGFRIVGKRERIAQRDGTWHDNLLLERRSPHLL